VGPITSWKEGRKEDGRMGERKDGRKPGKERRKEGGGREDE
jgi:hypothetical protein